MLMLLGAYLDCEVCVRFKGTLDSIPTGGRPRLYAMRNGYDFPCDLWLLFYVRF
jgi:hypothetical protein